MAAAARIGQRSRPSTYSTPAPTEAPHGLSSRAVSRVSSAEAGSQAPW